MIEIGDLILHSQFCTHGIVTTIYKSFGYKYCDVMWIETGHISQAILTEDCQKIS